MSNRLTFSLASLVLLFAFVVIPAMAHDQDPDTAGDQHGTTGSFDNVDGHTHPRVTVMIDDGDPNTDGMQIIDTKADAATDTNGLTLQFDLKYSVPYDHNAVLGSPSVARAGYVQAAGIYIQVYDSKTNMAPTGMTTLATGAISTTTVPDITATDAAAKMWKQTLELEFDTIANRDTALGNGIIVALMVGEGVYTVPAAILGTTDAGQANLAGLRQVYMVAAAAAMPPVVKKAATVEVAANTYHGGGRFMVTITFDADPGTMFTEDDIDPGANARILPGTFNKVATPPMGKTQYTVIIEANLPSETGDIVVTIASDSDVAMAATMKGSATVKAKADTPAPTLASGTYALSGSLPAKGFGVITRAAVDGIASPKAMVPMMPDLQRFFAERGSITLYTTDANIKANDVVISEIMWGLNLSAATVAGRDDHQWIELYNATGSPIDLSKIRINFYRSFALPTNDNKVDQISNVEHAGWTVDQGQNGSLTPGENAAAVNLVSMYRNINYSHVKTWVDKTGDLNRGERNKGIPNGRAKGSWKTSNTSDIFALNRIGSPGMGHILVGGDYGTTGVPRSPIIITEVGNLNGEAHDWIELTATANVNLEKYELQYVKSDKSIVVLAQFVKKQLNAGEILLVLGTHPSNAGHPVAAGKEWKLGAADQVKPKASSLYHVDSRMKLPDSIGKATFIIRKEKGKTNHEHIIDLAGNLFIADSSAAYRTNLWPLRAAGAGHGNVIDGADENFNAPKAYQRNDRGSGTGEKDWNTRGFTGVGYDRVASGANAPGTPGFDNGFVRDKDSTLTGGAITISEIMYERVGNAPQWIELYNSSKTEGVNLNEWKLRIDNDRADTDVDIRFRPTIQFGSIHIPPNETVLIVSAATGQNSGNFPRHRIVDLWATTSHRSELEVENRNYQLLSTKAFKLTLIEKGGATVEMVGNLDAEMAWELPASEAGERGSIIRKYTDQEAGDGTMMGEWTHASTSPLTRSPVHLYYGRRDDMGTPGYRGGGPLPVSLSKFRPERLDSGEIVVRWITESELNNAGFNILRSEARNGEFTKLNTKLIAGQGTTSERTAYEYADTSAKPNVVYYYQIQDVSLDGQVQTLRQSRLKGNVTAAGKLTTTWGELKALQ
ncbi:lamin tail domain-containing protein [Candidatus Poribacteria bacterium]|nr:lamin tail domain-containing protein [Candidatus Poribacteria bacterium]